MDAGPGSRSRGFFSAIKASWDGSSMTGQGSVRLVIEVSDYIEITAVSENVKMWIWRGNKVDWGRYADEWRSQDDVTMVKKLAGCARSDDRISAQVKELKERLQVTFKQQNGPVASILIWQLILEEENSSHRMLKILDSATQNLHASEKESKHYKDKIKELEEKNEKDTETIQFLLNAAKKHDDEFLKILNQRAAANEYNQSRIDELETKLHEYEHDDQSENTGEDNKLDTQHNDFNLMTIHNSLTYNFDQEQQIPDLSSLANLSSQQIISQNDLTAVDDTTSLPSSLDSKRSRLYRNQANNPTSALPRSQQGGPSSISQSFKPIDEKRPYLDTATAPQFSPTEDKSSPTSQTAPEPKRQKSDNHTDLNSPKIKDDLHSDEEEDEDELNPAWLL